MSTNRVQIVECEMCNVSVSRETCSECSACGACKCPSCSCYKCCNGEDM